MKNYKVVFLAIALLICAIYTPLPAASAVRAATRVHSHDYGCGTEIYCDTSACDSSPHTTYYGGRPATWHPGVPIIRYQDYCNSEINACAYCYKRWNNGSCTCGVIIDIENVRFNTETSTYSFDAIVTNNVLGLSSVPYNFGSGWTTNRHYETGNTRVTVSGKNSNNGTSQKIFNMLDYDLSPPTGSISGNVSEWTKDDVTLTITAEDPESGLSAEAYSFDNGLSWQASNQKSFSSNTTVNAKVKNGAGLITDLPVQVIDKIDKTKPTAYVSGIPNAWQTTAAILTVNASDTESGIHPEGYSFDGGITWQSENKKTFGSFVNSVNISVRDLSGNITDIIPFQLKVDNTAPVVSINGIPSAWQNTNAVIEIIANDIGIGLHSKSFSFDGGVSWQAENTHTYTENGIISNIRVRDALGNTLNVPAFTIDKIDTEAPLATVKGNPLQWQLNALIEIEATDLGAGLHSKGFSFDGGVTWQAENTHTYTENGIINNIRVRDALGNTLNVPSFTVDKIDAEAPLATVKGNPLQWQLNALIEIEATDLGAGLNSESFSFDGGVTWQAENTHIYSENGVISNIRVRDALGNTLNVPDFIIDKIDAEAPLATVKGNPLQWQLNALIEIEAADLGTGLHSESFSFDGGVTWQAENTHTYTENGVISNIRVRDALGNTLNIPAFTIDKIDTEAPSATVNGVTNIWQNTDALIEIVASDNGIGLHSESFSFDGGVTWQADNTHVYTKNCFVDNIRVRDALNNTLVVNSFNISNIDKEAPILVSESGPIVTKDKNLAMSYKISDNLSGLSNEFVLTTSAKNNPDTEHSVTINYQSSDNAFIKDALFEIGTSTNPNLKAGDTIVGKIELIDLVGNKSSISIKPVLFDNVAPFISSVKINEGWTNISKTASINAYDKGTGISGYAFSTDTNTRSLLWLETPEKQFSDNCEMYAFVKDVYGNISKPFLFSVSQIDKQPPTIKGIKNISGIKSDMQSFIVLAEDFESGVNEYGISLSPLNDTAKWNVLKASNFTVSANKTYYLFAKDNAGNITKPYRYEVNTIDNTPPSLDYNIPTGWTNSDITITITASDDNSGVQAIILPDGSLVSTSIFQYTFTANGNYLFTVYDNSRNEQTYTISIENIDKVAPQILYSTESSETNAVIFLSASDELSGIAYIINPDGIKQSSLNVSYETTENGVYTFKAFDNAGNMREYAVEISGITPIVIKEPETFQESAVKIVKAVAQTAVAAAPVAAAGGGTYFLFMLIGADVIVIDDKQKKKHRAWLSGDNTLDLTKINKKTGALHYQIIFRHKWIKANSGREISVLINGVSVAKAVVTFENNVVEI